MEKWWCILFFGGEWWRLSFFGGEKLGKSGFFREKNIKKIGILGLYFQDGCITMWLIVAQSGVLWWKNIIKVGKWRRVVTARCSWDNINIPLMQRGV